MIDQGVGLIEVAGSQNGFVGSAIEQIKQIPPVIPRNRYDQD